MEENLKLITEIDGYLKIVRSYPLISLSFFQALRVIRGNVLENGRFEDGERFEIKRILLEPQFFRYVISVLDNQNLQDIWDWENRTLTVGNGTLFFHFNPKLCPQKIEILRWKAKLPEYKEHEVSAASNGDKVACKKRVIFPIMLKKN